MGGWQVAINFNVKHQGKDIHHPPSTIHKWPFSDLTRSTLCPSLSLSFTIISPSQIVTDSPQVWWVFGRAGNNVGGCSNQGLITVGNWKPQPLLAVWLGAGITQFLLVMEMKTAWAWRVAAWAAAAWRAVIAPAPAADNLEKYAAALHTAPLLPALGWALTSSN